MTWTTLSGFMLFVPNMNVCMLYDLYVFIFYFCQHMCLHASLCSCPVNTYHSYISMLATGDEVESFLRLKIGETTLKAQGIITVVFFYKCNPNEVILAKWIKKTFMSCLNFDRKLFWTVICGVYAFDLVLEEFIRYWSGLILSNWQWNSFWE